MREYIVKKIDEFLAAFMRWFEQDTEGRYETFDVKWMSAHEYLESR